MVFVVDLLEYIDERQTPFRKFVTLGLMAKGLEVPIIGFKMTEKGADECRVNQIENSVFISNNMFNTQYFLDKTKGADKN